MNNSVLQFVFSGLGALCAVGAALSRNHRASLGVAAICAFSAALGAHYDAFWVTAIAGLSMVWAAICALPTIDFAWRVKTGLVAAVALGAFLCLWPTLESLSNGRIRCPSYVRDRVEFRLVAGLDLRGGLRLVYTVDVDEAIKDKRDRYFDDMRQQLAQAYGLTAEDKPVSREGVVKLAEKVDLEKVRNTVDSISLTFKDPSEVTKLDGKFATHFTSELARQPGNSPAQVVYRIRASVDSSIRERAVDQAKETIGKRVDELGLKEAAVTVRDEDIIIEVPGQDEKTFQEIREIISRTARLEFKLLDDSSDFFAKLSEASGNELLAQGVRFGVERAPTGPNHKVSSPNQLQYASPTYAYTSHRPDETMAAAKTRFREWLSTLSPPSDHEIGVGTYTEDDAEGNSTEVGWRTYYLYGKAEVTGDQIRDAQARPAMDSSGRATGNEWEVGIDFTQSGSSRFEDISGNNINKRFAIILDDVVTSAPKINEKISGGARISMSERGDAQARADEARKLELVLRSGALPAPITPSNEQRIGASLGSDAIKQGLYGALAGAGLVLVFMAFYYHVAGVVADLAVLFNLFLQLAILASFGASMTLPGIAGLALTVGMAVDANVLINERIREELRHGKNPRAAVDVGYEKALSAIIDGHMTTFISGLILAQYGTGPIKGFAVTLLVGMVASLFTSVVCTRLAFDWWVRGRRVKTLNLG